MCTLDLNKTESKTLQGEKVVLSRVLWYFYELLRNQWLKPNELVRLQEKRLKAILRYVYENVPLYREKFESKGMRPEDIKTLEDLSKLPFTTKQEIRSGIPDQSISREYDVNECIKVHTSGTTGGPMPVFYDKRFYDYCIANWEGRRLMSIGINRFDKFMAVSHPYIYAEHPAERNDNVKRKVWRLAFGPLVSFLRSRRKTVYFKDDVESVIADIVKFQPKMIDGTLSYLRVLAEALVNRGLDFPNLEVVRSDGEVLDEFTRRFLESSFKCKVFDEYSTWDFGHGAWECERREGYHIDADFLILEIVRNNEQAALGERGEIVVTGLLNYAMPLIRYRVGDIGVFDHEMCSCGRGLPLLKSIDGRKVDCFTLPNSRIVSPKIIISAVQVTSGVSRYQIVQKSRNKITVELMRRKNDQDVSTDELLARCHAVLGNNVEIEVFVSDRKGLKVKFRPVISELTVDGETRWIETRRNF